MKCTIYIAVLVFFVSCKGDQKDDCFTSLGEVATEAREIAAFSKIYVEDRIQVVLSQDTSNHGTLEVIGPKNLLDQITTEVVDGELLLKNTNTCNFVRSFDYDIKVLVNVDKLSRLQLESISTVSCVDSLDIDFLEVFHNALSDISLLVKGREVFIQSLNSSTTNMSGAIRVLKGSIEEISELNAENLKCEEVLLDSHTPLDCFVTASKGLYIKIYNSGNMYYSIEPSVYKVVAENSGTGKLLKK